MINRVKPMALVMALLTTVAQSGCSVGLITGASCPVRVSVGGRAYSHRHPRTGYGYYAPRLYDPYDGPGYGSYCAWFASGNLISCN